MNMRIAYILIGLAMFFTLNAETTVDSLFTAGNQQYAEGNFNAALSSYEMINQLGFESAELYFNMANSYYKTGDNPRAILYYERSLLLNPGDEDILFNLAKARMTNIDKIDEIPSFIIQRWIDNVINLLHSNIWAIISICTFIAGLILLLLYFIAMRIEWKRFGLYGFVVLIIFAVSGFIMAAKSKELIINSSGAIVMSSTVTVKGSPRETGTDLFIIHEGTKVILLKPLDDWYEIKLTDGKQGWLLKSDVEPI